MRLIRLIFWLLIILLIAFVVIKRNEVVLYLEKITHGDRAISTNQANKTTTELKPAQASKDADVKSSRSEATSRDSTTEKAKTITKSDEPPSTREPAQKKIDQMDDTIGVAPKADVKPANNVDQTWLHDRARQAVKDGEYQTAIKAYQEMLETNPSQADKWGELGDMFHQMGENVRAAQAYANAVVVFKQQGKTDVVNKILPYIERYTPELVDKIRNTR